MDSTFFLRQLDIADPSQFKDKSVTVIGAGGIGPAKAMQLMAALELGRRSTLEQEDDRPQITCPADAANLLINKMDALDQEHLVVISLDTRNRVLGQETLYIGNVNTGIVRIAEIFRLPIRQNSNAIIISHNHPSGDPSPSPEDVSVTRQIVEKPVSSWTSTCWTTW